MLQRLEARTMVTTPRPVRSVAFLTETVINNSDGPVEMFLEQNGGLGSTLLAKKWQRSTKPVQEPVNVRGVTIATLLQQTVTPRSDNNHSHLIIKMDIEGAEYTVLNHSWMTLCQAVEQNPKLRIDLLLELHGPNKIGENAAMSAFWRVDVKKRLLDCGVRLRTGNSVA